MVEWFSLLAVGTSMLGTLLSFSEFFKEQLSNISLNFSITKTVQVISSVPDSMLSPNISAIYLHVEAQN